MSISERELHIDLDHVVFPFHDHFKPYMPEPLGIHEITDYTKLHELMDMPPKEVYRLIKKFLEDPSSQTIPPINGASEAHSLLMDRGFSVRYVTAREPSTEDTTRTWLETHITNGEEPKVVFTGSDGGVGSKQEAFTLHGPLAVIDDSPKHIKEAISAGIEVPVLFGDYPWTRIKPDGSESAKDWPEVLQLVLE